MTHFVNQHEPAPVATAPAVLSDEQFAELKRLLEPGYELAKLYLEQLRANPAQTDKQDADAPSSARASRSKG